MATDHRGQPLHAGKRTHDEMFDLGHSGMGFNGRMNDKSALLEPRPAGAFAEENEDGIIDDPYIWGRLTGHMDGRVDAPGSGIKRATGVMASDHRGNHVHAGKRTDDKIMANPFYNAGDPLLQKATMDRMQNPVPNSKPSSVKSMVTINDIKQSASNAGRKIANSGYGSAAMIGAAAGGALLGGGINLAAGEVGHPAENLPVMDTPQVAKGMVIGAALGVAGKFVNDTRKMPQSRKQKY